MPRRGSAWVLNHLYCHQMITMDDRRVSVKVKILEKSLVAQNNLNNNNFGYQRPIDVAWDRCGD